MPERIPRRTYKWILGFFFGFIFFQGLLLSPTGAWADSWAGTPEGRANASPVTSSVVAPKDTTQEAKGGAATAQAKKPAEEGCSWGSNIVYCAVKFVLEAIHSMAAWIANGAASLLVWVVNPENITGPNGMLNKASVYNLWKFIRDFFNLFFILILLVSAFATIFQVESFSIRKIFLNILFAALIINFSFPITRFLIDLTNVPMYYFLNVTVEGTQGGALKITNSLLGASGISSTYLQVVDLSKLMMNVIFTFLFAISLLILAVMLLIRVIALVLLLIFSPLGFAASLLPGMHSLGQQWWTKFWNYALFGPAAALMLMISVRFMNEIAIDGTFGTMVATSSQMSASTLASSAIAQITFFTIPIILIWTAIGMANSGSIAGAGLIVGKGQQFAKWSGKKMGQGAKWVGVNNPVSKTVKGAASGVKDKVTDSKFAKWVKSPSYFESGAKGLVKGKGWGGGVKGAKEKYHNEQVNKEFEEMKKNNVSNTELNKNLGGGDKVKAASAAMLLTDRKAIKTTADFEKALDALGDNTKEIAELIEKAGDGVMDSLSVNQYKKVAAVESRAVAAGYNPEIQKQLDARLTKEGASKVRVDYELDIATGGTPAAATPAQLEAAVRRVLEPMKSARDVAKQESLFDDPAYSSMAQFVITDVRTLDQIQQIKKSSNEEGTSVASYFP